MSEQQPRFLYIYVMASNPEGPVKIGRAGSPAKRLGDLQPGHPHRLRVWHAVSCPEAEAANMEFGIHKRLKDRRLAGEWFNLCVMEAVHETHEVLRYIYGSVEDSVARAAKAGDLLVYPQGQPDYAHVNAAFLIPPPATRAELIGWLPARWIAGMA